MKLALIPLYAAALPFFLFPVEILLPYPHVVEELAKGILIYFILKTRSKLSKKVFVVISMAILFTISETILYLFNIYYSRDLSNLLLRIISTGSLHLATSLLIFVSSINKRVLIFLGIVVAITIHYLYNISIPYLF